MPSGDLLSLLKRQNAGFLPHYTLLWWKKRRLKSFLKFPLVTSE